MTTQSLKASTTLSNSTTYGADALRYAKAEAEANIGALYMAHTHAAIYRDLRNKLAAKSADDSERDIILNHWRSFPEGEAHEKKKKGFPAHKDRSPEQHATFNAMLRWESNINTQTLRAIKVRTGLDILEKQERLVIVEKIEGTKEWQCNVRAEKVLKERNNTAFNVRQLSTIADIAKQITAKTSTHNVLKKAKTGKQDTPDKAPGGAVERIDQSKLGAVLKQVNASLTTFVKDDGSLALPPDALAECKRNFALTYHRLTAKQRDEALAEYKADADKAAAKEAAALAAKKQAVAPAKPAAPVAQVAASK